MVKVIRSSGRDIGKDWESTLNGVFSTISRDYVFTVHRLVDTGTAGNFVNSQPSDYLVAYRGKLAYLEAKASTVARNFRPSMLRPKQRQTIIRDSIMGEVPFLILFGDLQMQTYQLLNGATILQKDVPTERSILASGDIKDLHSDLLRYFEPKPLAPTLAKCKNIIQNLK